MAVLKYYFADGHNKELEVTEEFATEYAEMEHKDKLVERKETRRHQSLDKSMEHGWDVVDLKMDVQAEVEWNEERERLHRAISRLSHEQQVLLDEVYFQYVPQKEIAKREKVSEAAISARITRILSKLKKYLQ